METITTDLCVIGAGAAGLSVASTAALLGVPVVLIERGAMGGDCLNHGCVPSKALIAAAAKAMTPSPEFGVHARQSHVDGQAVMARVRQVIAGIAPVDSVARYRALGARVVEGEARFVDGRTVAVGQTQVRARRFVIAAGARPAIPDLPGLSELPYLTTDTLFAEPDLPRRLAIVGGGPVGMELAQAFVRLGSEVALIEAGATVLRGEDPEAVAIVRARLRHEGVRIHEQATIQRLQPLTSGLTIDLSGPGVPSMLNEGRLLVAVGRTPALAALELSKAGVEYGPAGITVDDRQRTTNRRIFAIGDCCAGRPRLTHAAAAMANVVVRNAIFRQRARFEPRHVPRVTYTDPEIASVGLTETEARNAHGRVQTLRWPFSENDRARIDGVPEGFVKVMIDRKSTILGVTIVGHGAGDLVMPWLLAMQNGLKVEAMAAVQPAYPTLSEASRRAALQALTPRLRNPLVGRLIRALRLLG